METVRVTAAEYVFQQGTSNKYWRIFLSDSFLDSHGSSTGILATHYGRVGSAGSVTVKRFYHTPYNEAYDLEHSKERKGYLEKDRVQLAVPTTILDLSRSTNQTGSGGNSTACTRALIAAYHGALAETNKTNHGLDPIADLIHNTSDGYKAMLAALAGYPIEQEILRQDIEYLEVLASLTAHA
jgi:predicted DNA-binding WGR domain protein